MKFNEEELELLIALYEDELKEAGSYIHELQKTLAKLRTQIDLSEIEPGLPLKKRGRKPKIQSGESKPKVAKKRGRKPKILTELLRPITGTKRGRKPKIQQKYTPLVTMVEDMSGPRKRKSNKTNNLAGLNFQEEQTPKVEIPVLEEIKE